MAAKEELYKRITIAGILGFIPLILGAGALAGFLAGEFLRKKFGVAYFILPICIGITLTASIFESIRLIKLALKIDKKN